MRVAFCPQAHTHTLGCARRSQLVFMETIVQVFICNASVVGLVDERETSVTSWKRLRNEESGESVICTLPSLGVQEVSHDWRRELRWQTLIGSNQLTSDNRNSRNRLQTRVTDKTTGLQPTRTAHSTIVVVS